jgi:hypothetical protein
MQRPFFEAAEGRRQVLLLLAVCALLGGAVAVGVSPRSTEILTGIRGAEEIEAPDDLPPLATDDATRFFGDRDEIEIRVAANTTLRAFLDRNRLNKPYHRAQIVEQLGSAAPSAPLAAGPRFKLRLTPMASDIPGATAKGKAAPQ